GQAVDLVFTDLAPDQEGNPYFPRQQGAAIWQFPASGLRATLIAEQRRQGVRVLIDVDDNYLTWRPADKGRADWAQNLSHDPYQHSVEEHARLVPHVDGVICATPVLADTY